MKLDQFAYELVGANRAEPPSQYFSHDGLVFEAERPPFAKAPGCIGGTEPRQPLRQPLTNMIRQSHRPDTSPNVCRQARKG